MVYFSGRAEVTLGDIRSGEKRASLPILGFFHMVIASGIFGRVSRCEMRSIDAK